MVKCCSLCTVISASALLLLTACNQDKTDSQISVAEPAPSQATATSAVAAHQKANAQDNCPRLVQKKVDSNQVLRQDTMAGQACDYFIYPYIGDTIQASISDDRIRLSLVRPDTHDFANGNFVVTKNGRHVLRLEYDAFDRRPALMHYTIEIDIIPPSSP